MIGCEFPACVWSGPTSELQEHLFVIHDAGSWGGPDCEKCGGVGEYLASRVAKWDGEEDWRICPACKGSGIA